MPRKTLAQVVKERYPGEYDDVPDAHLEATIRKAYPGEYDDVPHTMARPEDFTPQQQGPEGSATSRFLSNAGQVLNPIEAIKGLANAVAHPIDTIGNIGQMHAEQLGKARDAFSQGRISEGIGHGVATVLPVVGPMAAQAGEQIASGDIAGGLGKGAALAASGGLAGPATRAVGKAVQAPAKATGRAMYQSALKPTKAVLKGVRAVKGPDGARKTLIDTGLMEGIPVSEAGARKVGNLIDSLNTEVQAKLKDATQRGATVSPDAVEDAIRAVAKDFTDQINAQPDLAAIETVAQNFSANPNASKVVSGPAGSARVPTDIPVATAQKMKSNTYQGLRGKYGKEGGGTIEAEKAGARALKEGIEHAAPEVKALNAREGSLIPLEEAVADAMRRRGNYGLFGLSPMVAAIPAITHGNAWPLLAAMVDRMPGVVSRTGIWISRTGSRSGRKTQEAARAAAVGTATSPNESRNRTRGRGALTPSLAQ